MATQQTVPYVVPQSKLTVVLSVPKPAPKAISQEDLEEIMLLRNMVKQKQDLLARVESGLKERLEAGATVEEGVHIAELKETFRRNVAWREVAVRLGDRLYGDGQGEGYCERVIGGTKPTKTVSLNVA